MQLIKSYKIKNNPNNPRFIKDWKFNKLVQSIKEFPEMLEKRPLVCYTQDKEYIVLGGNMRLKACLQLGMKDIPVLLCDDWTEEQKRQFIIKDNLDMGEWDIDQLANEWEIEDLKDWGIDLKELNTWNVDEIEKADFISNDIREQVKKEVLESLTIEEIPEGVKDQIRMDISRYASGHEVNSMTDDEVDINEQFDPYGSAASLHKIIIIFDSVEQGKEFYENNLKDYPYKNYSAGQGSFWQINLSNEYGKKNK
jgi:hypothetical protein